MATEKILQDTPEFMVVEVTVPGGTNIEVRPKAGSPEANRATLEQSGLQALETNRAYIAKAPPSQSELAAQVKELSRQNNGIIRLLLNKLDGVN